ncbi:DNA-binding domain-containing protein [Thermomonas carbonis]|uniref:Putative DNA-binding domain-containing protein n=1 Tax=Thermomonas carbonis TaxID=1463158 RepID=A0A7G9STL5_9GAMM|nr:putative DNA-binding domain-containing protein [Thermomonas carbonis]QNN71190.1 putative DNA-binding domain-containing protein [Thermomonas carbonis]GHC11346.1 DUF2063 domain-containing protein [Thermomonas carbonis]
MNAVPTLQQRQSAMQAWLLHGDAGFAGAIDPARLHGETRDDRLRIYADAYRLRLADVLGQDYPATQAVLGDARFDALADAYLRAHPSTRPSVRHFGHAFADWLASRREVPRKISDLARFEWQQGEVFDAADADALGFDAIATLPAQSWPALQLKLHPATRLLALRTNAADVVDARARGLPLPRLRDRATTHWLLWRNAADVHWRRLDLDEAEALQAIQCGDTFARLCERSHARHADGALRAASLLKRWLADGVLAADVFHSHPD